MAELHRRTGIALATNMVVTDLDEFRRNVELNAVQIILADHHYWGGLRDTQILARMCATFGLGVSMHSNSHLGISLMAMAHVAAAVPNLSYACDTHYPWQDEDVIAGGKVPIVGGCVRICCLLSRGMLTLCNWLSAGSGATTRFRFPARYSVLPSAATARRGRRGQSVDFRHPGK